MSKIERILIVGAGMAGLTLAISLKRKGFHADIVERQPDEPTQGAGIYLLGDAMRVLESLGLIANHGAATAVQFSDGSDRPARRVLRWWWKHQASMYQQFCAHRSIGDIAGIGSWVQSRSKLCIMT
jgi:2-polyprenyl-6-methoxyphenol hydroxylase-like FAD-dependent oxidoreductase